MRMTERKEVIEEPGPVNKAILENTAKMRA